MAIVSSDTVLSQNETEISLTCSFPTKQSYFDDCTKDILQELQKDDIDSEKENSNAEP